MNDLVIALKAVPAFAELDAAELDALAHAMSVDGYHDGHVFMREGDTRRSIQDAAYVLLEGRVRVTRSSDPKKALTRELGAGEMFGLIALVDRGGRSATCTAIGEVKAAALNRAAFEHLLHSNAELACKFQLVVAAQLARDWDRLQRQLRDALSAALPSRPGT